jgi:hypothetical protein
MSLSCDGERAGREQPGRLHRFDHSPHDLGASRRSKCKGGFAPQCRLEYGLINERVEYLTWATLEEQPSPLCPFHCFAESRIVQSSGRSLATSITEGAANAKI